MHIMNIPEPTGYLRGLNSTWAPYGEKGPQHAQNPSPEPLDTIERSGELQISQRRAPVSTDSTDTHMSALRENFRIPTTPGYQARESLPHEQTSINIHMSHSCDSRPENFVAHHNGTLCILQDSPTRGCPVEEKSINFAARYGVLSPAGSSPESENAPAVTGAPAASYSRAFVNNYMDARQIDERVMALAKKYPDLVKVTTRDYQTAGYDGKNESLKGPAPLRYVTIGNNKGDNGSKPGVLFMAAPHGREKMNPLAMVELMEQLCANYRPGSNDPRVKEITDLVDSLNIYIAPVTNPDGLNYAIHDDPEWRKTRAPLAESKDGDRGVDINRNFDIEWTPYPQGCSEEQQKVIRETGMLPHPQDITRRLGRWTQYDGYPGAASFSEPETRHIAALVDEHPEIRIACDFHSHGEKVMIPDGVTNTRDREIFESLQKRMIEAVGRPQGESYRPELSYNVNGQSDDYLYRRKGIYALTMEDGKTFNPSVPEALKVVDSMASGAIELLRAAKELGKRPSLSGPVAF